MDQAKQFIYKGMKIEEIILGFPQKAQKLRRTIKNIAPLIEDIHHETLEGFLVAHGKEPLEVEPFVDRLNAILQEQMNEGTISITDAAAAKFKEEADCALKFADQVGSCGTGYEYILEPSASHESDDHIFFCKGVEIRVPSGSIKRLMGSVIDYVEGFEDDHFPGLLRLGFTIANPNVKSTCDCGCSTGYGA